jgi:Ca2+-binding RTX toxin-like protein
MRHRWIRAAGLGLALLAGVPAAAQTCYGLTCTITGTTGSDSLTGTAGSDVICGLAGNDTISGGDGNDTICGNGGTDTLYGQGGSDVLLGQQGDDYLDGGTGSDWAQFESAVSSASLLSGSANDGLGIDTLVSIENLGGSSGNDTLIGDHGNNVLDGQGGNDYLFANDGTDVLNGRNGTDYLCGGNGADTLDGGPGTDTACYYTAITVDLMTGSASDGDTLAGIEDLITSDQNDVLLGNGSANYFFSGGGADYLDGRGGTDICDAEIPSPPNETDVCTTACETAINCNIQ